jgi:hypothetical protein
MIILILLGFLITLSCGGELDHKVEYDVTDRLAWSGLNVSFDENGAILRSGDGTTPAMIRRRVKRLVQNRVYRLSIRVKAFGEPTGNVHVDLYLGEQYDSPDQELVVSLHDIRPSPRRFTRLLNSGKFDELPYLRAYTFSSVPVLVEEIVIEEVH